MANRCAGLDPTWAHFPAPALTQPAHAAAAGHCHSTSSSWLFPAAAFENEALTCALRASMSPANASSSYPTTPSSSSISSASDDLLSGGYDTPAASRPAPTRGPKIAAGGRVTKRKPRPSRRAPVTYITADPANFRRMVQEITGFPVITSSGAGGVRRKAATASEPASAAPRWPAAEPACALPTLDTSAFLLDREVTTTSARVPPEDKSSSGSASPAMPVAAAAVDDDDASVLVELEAIACDPAFVSGFPTLESWGII